MKPGTVFKHNNGTDYLVLGNKNNLTLIAQMGEYKTAHYIVANGINHLENDRYDWNFGHYFMEDIISAARYLDNPERERKRIQAANERKNRPKKRGRDFSF